VDSSLFLRHAGHMIDADLQSVALFLFFLLEDFVRCCLSVCTAVCGLTAVCIQKVNEN